MGNFVPRAGAVKYQRDDGTWSYANPNDLLFSTVTMCATHYWNGEAWKRIFESDPNDFYLEDDSNEP